MRNPAETRRPDDLAPPSILVVEHEALMAHDLESSLMRFGYQVLATAASAAEAIQAVDTYHPDLVLMDVGLEAGDDGIMAAAAIRARYPTPIVFLTSQTDDALLTRAQHEAQPHGYVLKPYQNDDLRAAVQVALERHTLEQEIRQQRSLLAGVLSGMSDAVIAADIEGKIVLVNDAGRRAFGENLVNAWDTTSTRICLPDETRCPSDELPLTRALRGEVIRDMELFIQSSEQPDGRWYSVNATPLLDGEGLVCGAVAVGRDVTDVRAAHWELQQLARTDGLTGTYNRSAFMQVAREALETARGSGRRPAVFFIDLNGMKRINDSLGHPEGDRLLVDVTSILRASFRTSDIVGRLGGDEFVVLAPDAGEHADALHTRLRGAVDSFNAASSRAYRISISIGHCTYDPREPAGLEDLVKQADRRMYEDKVKRDVLRAPAARKSKAASDGGSITRTSSRGTRSRRTS